MPDQPSPISPRIAQLEKDLSTGKQNALATFWQEIEHHGTPLIEPIAGDNDHCLATFLWRDTGDIKNVVIFAGPAGWDSPEKNQMAQLIRLDRSSLAPAMEGWPPRSSACAHQKFSATYSRNPDLSGGTATPNITSLQNGSSNNTLLAHVYHCVSTSK